MRDAATAQTALPIVKPTIKTHMLRRKMEILLSIDTSTAGPDLNPEISEDLSRGPHLPHSLRKNVDPHFLRTAIAQPNHKKKYGCHLVSDLEGAT